MSLPMVKKSSVRATFMPRLPLCEKQCPGCPFRPDRGVLKGDESGDFEAAQFAASNGDFYCHDTVYDKSGEIVVKRDMKQWRVCRGAFEFRKKVEVERRINALRAEGRLLENE